MGEGGIRYLLLAVVLCVVAVGSAVSVGAIRELTFGTLSTAKLAEQKSGEVILNLTSSGGVLFDTAKNRVVANASAYFKGTIEDNHLKLEGVIMLGGKNVPLLWRVQQQRCLLDGTCQKMPNRRRLTSMEEPELFTKELKECTPFR